MPLDPGLVMRILVTVLFLVVGCDATSNSPSSPRSSSSATTSSSSPQQSLLEARRGFATRIVKSGESFGAPARPTGDEFELIQYRSPVGLLAAYVTPDPGDGMKHPAIVWIHGGDSNSIGDVWSPQERSNDQSASAFRKAGVVMMFPSQRGGNDNPGKREGFYGEVDDILAATDHLAKLPYVDPDQIYLGGHSTGGTMVMLVAACSDRYQAVFALGPVAGAGQYGGEYVYCDVNDEAEIRLRSPLYWLHCVQSPLFVLEGANEGNWDQAIDFMVKENKNPKVAFFKLEGHTHFSIVAPLAELLGKQIRNGKIQLTEETLVGLK
jgi:dipeptidyl aminopeptidase/acylaminoacyl peptidase